MGSRVTYWQVTFQGSHGQLMTLGLEALDKASAFQRALERMPFAPASFSVTEIPPLCTAHEVRHACGPRFEPAES